MMVKLKEIERLIELLELNDWDSEYPAFMRINREKINDVHLALCEMVKVHEELRKLAIKYSVKYECKGLDGGHN